MQRKAQSNDGQRLKLLENIVAHADIPAPNGTRLFDETTIQRTTDLSERLAAAIETRDAHLTARRQLRTQQITGTRNLKQMIRITWDMILYRVRAGTLPASALGLFGLSVEGNRPGPGDPREWIARGNRLISADSQLENSGYPAITEPSRVELQSEVERLQTITIAKESEENRLTGSREALRAIRTETENLIQEIVFRITIAYQNEPRIQRRQTMRVLGFRFGTQPSEPIAS